LEEAGLELIVDCPGIPDHVYIDHAVWENIVRNLVLNAFNGTFEGSIAVSIELQSDEVVVLFRDTGSGIPQAELHRIFEPFHRISGARRSQEGNTIGLALVPELVRHLGGAIDVWSEEGSGSSFKVTLPLGRVSLANPASLDIEAALAAPHYSISSTTQGHILLVDDSASTRGYLYRILSPTFRVSVAENGGAALAAIRKEQPDLILSDMVVPVFDGASLVRSLREDPETATIPVILVSSRVGEDGIGVCADIGADDYLVGPVSAGKLLATVRAQLQLSRVRRAAADAARELAKSRMDLVRRLETHKKDWKSSSGSMSDDEWPRFERIFGLVDILEKQFGTSLDSGSRRHLSGIASAAREMDDLVNNLASFSRVSQMEMKKSPVNLRRLVQEVVGQLDEPECAPPTEWVLGDLPCVVGDEDMLRLALVNLVSNALKFSSRRSRRRIEIGGAYSSEGSVVFQIRDNGIGFNMDYADRLFGVFQRLHPREEFEGLGIGLAIVDRILQRHGGQVWATGTEGEGATFYCSLPTAP
jgi:signal transduction histidine kinase/DNA-binding response OmpR family regulator